MASSELCRNGIILLLDGEQDDLRLIVKEGGGGGVLAEFPTDASLLRGVLGGYSYQVAASQGSLTISASGDLVLIRFENGSSSARRCQVAKSEYERSLNEFGHS